LNPVRIIDISMPIQAGLAAWPGDAPYKLSVTSTSNGDSVLNLGSVSMSVHTGTHVDAPFHFKNDGQPVERLDLDPFVGPAIVIDVAGKDRIQVRDLEASGASLPPRVLLKTGGWTDHRRFPESVPVIESYVPAFLSERGVRLLGVDVPSVDPLDSKDLANHHALAERGICILESLNLAAVAPGRYDLIALPLPLAGADASPCRAVLLTKE
jgi:arylformamidase